MQSSRGAVLVVALIAVALTGSGLVIFKPKWLHGDSKRAAAAVQTTTALVSAGENQNAKAAAVFSKIGETNVEAPESPQKKVIARFVPIGLSLTGAPDPAFLLDLEKLKSATLQGKLDQADKINAALLQDADATRRELARAIAGKLAADNELVVVAAERLGAERTQNIMIAMIVVLVALYAYTKISHISPGALSKIVADVRTGDTETNPAIVAIDTHTSRIQQLMTKGNYWLGSKIKKILS